MFADGKDRKCCNHTLHSSSDHADEPFPYCIWVHLHVSHLWIQRYNLGEYYQHQNPYSNTVHVNVAQGKLSVDGRIRTFRCNYLGRAWPSDVCRLVIDMTSDRGCTNVNWQNETFLLETVLMAAHLSKFFPRYLSNRSRVLHGQLTLVLLIVCMT